MTQITKILDEKSSIVFRNKALSFNSKIGYKIAVKQFLVYLERTGQKEGPGSVRAFLEEIRVTIKPATFNLKTQAIKEYLFAKYRDNHRQLFGIQETFKGIKKPKIQKAILQDDYLTLEQIESLCEKLTVKISLIAQTLFWTGARVSELINIKLENIETNKKAIIRIIGKGNKERTVYLPLSIYSLARGVFRGKVYLFETASGKQYHPVNVHREIKRQGKKFDYNIHPHTFRHSKAMYLKNEKKLSADQIAKALGHSSVVSTLESYFHGQPSAEDQGID